MKWFWTITGAGGVEAGMQIPNMRSVDDPSTPSFVREHCARLTAIHDADDNLLREMGIKPLSEPEIEVKIIG
jgi:hypothetical protein